MRSWRRGAAMTVVASVLLVGLVGCSPVPTGIIAVSISDDGVPTAVFRDCGDGDGMANITITVSGDSQRYVWESPSGDVTPGLVVLGSETRWATKNSLPEFQTGVEYRMSALSSGDSRSAIGVTFTLGDLERLKPGEVMLDRYDADSKAFVPVIESANDFLSAGCSKIR